MKKLFITLALAVAMFTAQSQTLVADETTIKELKASIKIETSNETIFSMLIKEFAVKKWTTEILTDRAGSYRSYTFSFKKEDADKVKQFFTRINKAK